MSWPWDGRGGATSIEGRVFEAHLKVASTLVVLDFLWYGASDHHRVALVVIISVVNCLKVILWLGYIRLLEGKVVHAEVL